MAAPARGPTSVQGPPGSSNTSYAVGGRVIQLSIECSAGYISTAIKRFASRAGSSGEALLHTSQNAFIGAAAMVPQSRPLLEILAAMPDFRSNRDKRHSLAVILALARS